MNRQATGMFFSEMKETIISGARKLTSIQRGKFYKPGRKQGNNSNL